MPTGEGIQQTGEVQSTTQVDNPIGRRGFLKRAAGFTAALLAPGLPRIEAPARIPAKAPAVEEEVRPFFDRWYPANTPIILPDESRFQEVEQSGKRLTMWEAVPQGLVMGILEGFNPLAAQTVKDYLSSHPGSRLLNQPVSDRSEAIYRVADLQTGAGFIAVSSESSSGLSILFVSQDPQNRITLTEITADQIYRSLGVNPPKNARLLTHGLAENGFLILSGRNKVVVVQQEDGTLAFRQKDRDTYLPWGLGDKFIQNTDGTMGVTDRDKAPVQQSTQLGEVVRSCRIGRAGSDYFVVSRDSVDSDGLHHISMEITDDQGTVISQLPRWVEVMPRARESIRFDLTPLDSRQGQYLLMLRMLANSEKRELPRHNPFAENNNDRILYVEARQIPGGKIEMTGVSVGSYAPWGSVEWAKPENHPETGRTGYEVKFRGSEGETEYTSRFLKVNPQPINTSVV